MKPLPTETMFFATQKSELRARSDRCQLPEKPAAASFRREQDVFGNSKQLLSVSMGWHPTNGA